MTSVMDRRAFLCGLAGGLSAPLAAEAQQTGKVARIGVLCAFTCGTGPPGSLPSLRKALRELGYIEGKGVAFEWRAAEGKLDRVPELATELVALKVDIIYVAGGTPEVRAARAATSTIPIVIAGIADPVRSGLASSLARPVETSLASPCRPRSLIRSGWSC